MTSTGNRPAAPGGTAMLAGRPVARVGYGVMQLATYTGHTAPDEDAAVAVLRRAVELGVNHLDTAHFYGDGQANARIRAALHPYTEDLVLVSKVGATEKAGALVTAQRPAELRAGVEADLAGLGAERIDVVNLRRADTPPGIVATGDQVVDLDDQLAELAALRDEGKIGGIGLSAVTLDQVRQAAPVGIACVQNAYNMLEREDEPILDWCRDNGVAWVPFFPLGSGFPGRPKVTDQPAVRAAAEALGAGAQQVGLAWLLGHAPNVLLIPGTTDPGHLAANVAAGDLHLDAETTATLDGLAS